jgi:hypothetical protein
MGSPLDRCVLGESVSDTVTPLEFVFLRHPLGTSQLVQAPDAETKGRRHRQHKFFRIADFFTISVVDM